MNNYVKCIFKMNKFDLIKEIHNNDVYKDDMTIVSYDSNGKLTDNVKVVTTYDKNGTLLAIIGEDKKNE